TDRTKRISYELPAHRGLPGERKTMNDTPGKDPKRIGDYLLCSKPVLQNAVKRQGQALKRGENPRPLGELLVETGAITPEEVEVAVRRQRVDRLRRCPVFSMLTDAELSAISSDRKSTRLNSSHVKIS